MNIQEEAKERDEKPQLHPIQLIDVKVRALQIELLTPVTDDIEVDIKHFSFSHSHSTYNEKSQTFIVMASAEIGIDDSGEVIDDGENQIALKVHVAGFFKVDENKFPKEHIESFAQRNAPLIVYPFLREHTYGLLTRAGISGVVLPLFQVPSFRIDKNVASG